MKRKITFLIAAMLLLTMITQPTRVWGQSDVYNSNVSFPSVSSPLSSCTVNIGTNGYSGIKMGTNNNKTGSFSITVPAGTRKLHVHAVGWTGKSSTLSVTTQSQGVKIKPSTAWSLTSDTGATGNSPFTINTTNNTTTSYYKEYTLSGVSSSTTITIANGNERAIVWGINAIKGHTITYSASDGSISGAVYGTQTPVISTDTIAEGEKVTLTATPASGYQFSAWSDGGDNSTLSSTSTNPTTFTMGTSNVTITATFVEAGNYFTISPTTKNVDAEGGDQEFTIDTDQTISTTANEAVQFYSDSEGTVTTDKPSWISSTAYSTATNKLTVTVAANHTATANGPAYFRAKNDDGSVTSEVVTISQDAYSVATPTFTVDAGSYYENQSVEIECTTDGATIYYTTDGTDPNSSSTEYTGAISVTSTTTIKAVAINYGISSSIASATYTLPITIAAARSQGTGTVYTKGIITYISGKNAYIQDETAAICMYKNENNVWNDYSTGDLVAVSGTLSTYTSGGNLLEVTTPNLTVTKLSTGNAKPCVTKTIAQINTDNFTDLQGMFVQIEKATYDYYDYKVSQGSDEIAVNGTMGEAEDGDVVTFKGNVIYYYSGECIKLYNLQEVTVVNDPTITASTTLDVPNYIVGTTQENITNATLAVTGSNLTENITAELYDGSNFEISSDNTNWDNTATITQTSGTANGTIYVRLKHNLSVDDYEDIINLSSGTADDVDVEISASVTYGHVTYDGNAEGVTNVPTDNTDYTYNQSVTVAGVGTMTNTGYTFTGWNSKANGSGSAFGVSFNITQDTTLYAQWTVNTHTLTLPATDAYGTYTADKSSPVAYGTKVTLTYTPEEGYEDYIAQWSSNDVTIASDDTFTMPDQNVTVTVTVIPNPYTKDVINRAFTGVTSTSYTSWNNKTGTSGAVYAGITTTNSNNNLQMNSGSNRGIITTTSGGKIKQLTVSWYSDPTDNRSITVYGKNTAYTATSDLYDNDKKGTSLGTLTKTNKTLIVSGDYTYVGLYASGAIYINEIDLFWEYVLPVDEGSLTQNTTIPANATVNETNLTIPDNKILTINGTLNVSGTFTNNGDATNIIVNDGGQLILPDNATVAATIKKTTSASTEATGSKDEAVNNWYAIASPVNNVAISSFAQGTHNVYCYDEPTHYWQEYHSALNTNPAYNNLTNGRGYIYRSTVANVEYAGNVNAAASITCPVTCTNEAGALKGFNLIGNPYTHNITKGASNANILNGTLLEENYYVLMPNGTWTLTYDGGEIAPGTAILVQATTKGDVTITNEAPTGGGKDSRFNNDNIWFTVKNNEFIDKACVEFKEGRGLNKMAHYNENAPMLYIRNNGENFASVDMPDNTKTINLCFKATEFGYNTLSLKANGNFSYLHLIDKLTGEDVDMLLEGEYSFMASPTDNPERFIVRLEYSEGSESSDSSFAYQNGSDIIVSGEGELQVFDVMGRLVMQKNINGVERINAEAQGVYIFKLNDKVQKIVIR